MDILIISPFFPYPLKSGGHTRLFNLIKHLSCRHNIDFISPILEEEKKHLAEVKKYCRNIVPISMDKYVDKKGKFKIDAEGVRYRIQKVYDC